MTDPHDHDERSSVNTSGLRNVEIASKVIRNSFKYKNWGLGLYFISFFYMVYLSLYLVLSGFVNLVISKYLVEIEENQKAIHTVCLVDSNLRLSLAELNNLFIVKNFNTSLNQSLVSYNSQYNDTPEKIIYDNTIDFANEGNSRFLNYSINILKMNSKIDPSIIEQLFSIKIPDPESHEPNRDYIHLSPIHSMHHHSISTLFPILFQDLNLKATELATSSNFVNISALNTKVAEITLKEIRERVVSLVEVGALQNYKDYFTSLVSFLSIFLFVLIVNWVLLLLASLSVDRRVKLIVGAYGFLKAPDVETMIMVIDNQKDLVSEYRFQESLLIDNFMDMGFHWRAIRGKLQLDNESVHIKGKVKPKIISVKSRGMLFSFKLSLAFNIFILILLLVVCFLIFFIQSSLQVSRQLYDSCDRGCQVMMSLNSAFLKTSLHLVFGDTFSIEGVPTSSEIWSKSAEELSSLWSMNQKVYSDSLSSEEFSRLRVLFHGNQCSSPEDERCLGFQGMIKVAVEFQQQERELFTWLSNENLKNLQVGQSSQFVPSLNYNYQVVEFRKHFVDSSKSFLEDWWKVILARALLLHYGVKSYLSLVQTTLPLVFGITALICAIISLKSYIREYTYSCETFKSVSPDMILTNPYLFNSFKRYFRVSLN